MSKLPENCPICGEKLKKGYISASRPVDIQWSEKRPSFSKLFFATGFEPLVKAGFWVFPITEALRCPNCKIVLFSHGEEKVEVKLTGKTQELYEELLHVYTTFFGGGRQVLEYEIESLMKQGLTREEAIHKLAEKEKPIKKSDFSMKVMRERFVPVPQDFLYARLRDALVSRRIGTVRKIEEVSKPSLIRVRTALGILVNINIKSETEGTRIDWDYSLKVLSYVFLVPFFSFFLFAVFIFAFYKLSLISLLPDIAGLTTLVLFMLLVTLRERRKTSEQIEKTLRDIESEYMQEEAIRKLTEKG